MTVLADFLIVEPPVAGLQRLRAGFRVTRMTGIGTRLTRSASPKPGCNASIIAAQRKRVLPGGSSLFTRTRRMMVMPARPAGLYIVCSTSTRR